MASPPYSHKKTTTEFRGGIKIRPHVVWIMGLILIALFGLLTRLGWVNPLSREYSQLVKFLGVLFALVALAMPFEDKSFNAHIRFVGSSALCLLLLLIITNLLVPPILVPGFGNVPEDEFASGLIAFAYGFPILIAGWLVKILGIWFTK